MLTAATLRIVDFCTRHSWTIIAAAVLLTALSAGHAARNFAIDTDINKLINPDLPWRQRELAYAAAFPQRLGTTLIVIDAKTPEMAQQAADLLTQRLSEQPALFTSIREPGGGAFFEQNGLLFQSPGQISGTAGRLTAATPILRNLVADQSLRGSLSALSYGVSGVRIGRLKLDDLARPMTMLSDTLDNTLAGRPASFSWRVLMSGEPATAMELRRFIEVKPVLDYNALERGHTASTAIRQAAADLKLAENFGARVRLTGEVPIADEEFGTLKEGAVLNHSLMVLAVLFFLWLALRSGRIILAVFLTLAAGLVMTAALGLTMVGALNPISVAFAVLFVGIGVDFGLQFSVRYRAERHGHDDIAAALRSTATKAGGPLALAAGATAAGFYSFLPTDYRGLSELGQIAGTGMLIAFLTSITLLPALLRIFNPPGEPHPLGFRWLAPVDRFLERHRMGVIAGTALAVLLGSPLLFYLRFDSNPLHLRSPKVESIATLLDLRKDPATNGSALEILAPSLEAANAIAERLRKLPEVAGTRTLSSFVPDAQEEKLALIRGAAGELDPVLNPSEMKPPPSDAENAEAAKSLADQLKQIAGNNEGPGATAAKRLSGLLSQLASAGQAARERTEAALIPPLKISLDGLRNSLQAQPITLETLPPDLISDWKTEDGRVRLQVTPKGDPTNTEALRQFANAVLAVEPTATGAPVSIFEAGHTIVQAFIEAGAWALLSITVLLWIALRRITDVLLTLVPLLLAGVVTLELCVLLDMPLNFANIIALPLLLGLGVAFKIYYIMAWRAGQTNLLQSVLTRAVIFSACTTATAFGSLWFSNHPGTSSMGKLLALSLVTTMAAAVLFQPVLMGPPRNDGDKT